MKNLYPENISKSYKSKRKRRTIQFLKYAKKWAGCLQKKIPKRSVCIGEGAGSCHSSWSVTWAPSLPGQNGQNQRLTIWAQRIWNNWYSSILLVGMQIVSTAFENWQLLVTVKQPSTVILDHMYEERSNKTKHVQGCLQQHEWISELFCWAKVNT